MAEDAEKQSSSAEKAYAAAAAAAPAKAEPAKPVAAPVVLKPEAPKAAKPTVQKVAAKLAKRAPAAKKKKPMTKTKTMPVAPKALPAPSTTQPTITQLKEKIMATAKTTDFSKTVTDTVSELQARAKAALDKGTELTAEATEFAKGNVEAMVEAGKILAAGMQDLGKTYADEAKAAYETATADFKELAAVKSPTELFQLQGKLLRRNFDTFVAYSSKNTEAVTKLANDSFAPLSSRASLASEKFSKVA